ncbi:MAG: hypothetical protein ACOC1W_04990, partial [Bacillota bacterium]
MADYLRKLGVIIFILILLPVLSGCDELQENADIEYNYLNLSVDNKYGVETIEPDLGRRDRGRYRYEDGSIVEIDFEVADGYEFLGWQGK